MRINIVLFWLVCIVQTLNGQEATKEKKFKAGTNISYSNINVNENFFIPGAEIKYEKSCFFLGPTFNFSNKIRLSGLQYSYRFYPYKKRGVCDLFLQSDVIGEYAHGRSEGLEWDGYNAIQTSVTHTSYKMYNSISYGLSTEVLKILVISHTLGFGFVREKHNYVYSNTKIKSGYYYQTELFISFKFGISMLI